MYLVADVLHVVRDDSDMSGGGTSAAHGRLDCLVSFFFVDGLDDLRTHHPVDSQIKSFAISTHNMRPGHGRAGFHIEILAAQLGITVSLPR